MTALVMISLLLLSCSCSDKSDNYRPNPILPEFNSEYSVESIKDLSEYTLVYPDYYSVDQMEDIYLLKNAIECVTDAEIKIVSDSEQFSGKTIVIASSKRVTTYEFEINSIGGKLDYIIAVGKDEVVLGGNNYYADVRAIYDFVNNYIGYNDINSEVDYSAVTEKIKGYKKVCYSDNDFITVAVDFEGEPRVNYSDVKRLKDTLFNAILIDTVNYTELQLKMLFKWCARCGIKVIMRGLMYEDVCVECPVVWGHCIVDRPYGEEAFEYYTEECKRYTELYSKYGWKPYVNLMGQSDTLGYLQSDNVYFDRVGALSFYSNSINMNYKNDFLSMYKYTSIIANKNKGEFWSCINSSSNFNVSDKKFYMWMFYLGVCYGAKGIQYFNYSDISDTDMEDKYDKRKYAAIKSVNREISNIDFLYSDYEYDRTYIFKGGEIVQGEDEKTEANFTIDEIVKNLYMDDDALYNVGCFLKKDGAGYAFVIVDSSVPNKETKRNITFELMHNVNSVKLYKNGYAVNANKIENDQYSVLLDSFGRAIILIEDM